MSEVSADTCAEALLSAREPSALLKHFFSFSELTFLPVIGAGSLYVLPGIESFNTTGMCFLKPIDEMPSGWPA